ncbi:dihydropteroate synthase [bacterium BMS3Abin04]|nr:dihydropteroate synthase [bacterium BMS3Abin04]
MTVRPINFAHKLNYNKYRPEIESLADPSFHSSELFGLEMAELTDLEYNILNSNLIKYGKENVVLVKTNFHNKEFVCLIGTNYSLNKFLLELCLKNDNSFFEELRLTLLNYTDYHLGSFKIGDKQFFNENSYVMGIINATPDSFSDGGKYLSPEKAIDRGIEMFDKGVDIIDIGGESTRPGAGKVSIEEEINRTILIIKGILKNRSEAVISIDTTKSEVAETALKEGALIVNDISGLTFDSKMLETVVKYEAALIIMHIKGIPKNMQDNPVYEEVINDVYEFLKRQSTIALQAGVKTVLVDPGIGFGKRVSDNYEILNRLDEFMGLGLPILIGLSKKSFIGEVLDLTVDERENATIVAETKAVKSGAVIVRTHNIDKALEAKKILNFIDNPNLVING